MPFEIWLILLASGRLILWLLQTSGLLRWLWALHPLLAELRDCDLCLGFWVYLALALLTDIDFGLWPWPIETIILAAVTTFLGHLLRLGWQAKFSTTIID